MKNLEIVAEELDEVGYFGQVEEEEENPEQEEVASGSVGSDSAQADEAPFPEGSVPSEGKDERGEGGVIDGRKVRRYEGSTRPPGISPELWSISTPRQKKATIAIYEKYRPPQHESLRWLNTLLIYSENA